MTSKIQQAIEELERISVSHAECNDRWYSCPLSLEGCANEAAINECTCGASELAAHLQTAIAALREIKPASDEKVFEQCRAEPHSHRSTAYLAGFRAAERFHWIGEQK
jgi:hypothetical protein